MSDTAEAFLDRVIPHLDALNRDKYSYKSWKFEKRPTNEGVGVVPGTEIDIQTAVNCVLDVEAYPENVKFVERNNILEKESDTAFTYVQRMSLPVIGKVQCALRVADYGEMSGYRVVAWTQNDEETMALPKKEGFRTEYNLGAWLFKDDEVSYALTSCPVKKDVGSLKFAILTRGADATGSQVVKENIQAMTNWATRSSE